MCGINGIVDFQAKITDKKPLIELMNQKIIYRGPNGQTHFVDKKVALGHCRLSIIDLSGGTQPIFNETGNILIVFNGEIYNFQILREQLVEKGHKFITHSDTEVILHLYEEYGEKCVEKLNGMFAFAIWDKKKEEFFLARDRVGEKPVVYSYDEKNQQLIFSSQEGPLFETGLVSKTLRDESISEFLTYGYIPAPYTIYQSVQKLPPGHYIRYSKGNFEMKQWWSLTSIKEDHTINYSEAKEEIRKRLFSIVEKQLVSDVPLGCFLSGGIDSSIIASIASQTSKEKIKTFSIGFNDNPVYDETPFAEQMARHIGSDHTTFHVDAAKLLEIMPYVLGEMGEPFGDSSILPSYILSHLTRSKVTVALSGDGADELFGGYNKYLMEHFVRKYPMPVLKAMKGMVSMLPDGRSNKILENIRKAKKMLSSVETKQEHRHFGLMNILRNNSSLIEDTTSKKYIEELYSNNQHFDYINRLLEADLNFVLPNDMLKKVDNASMLASLEVRVPFLDYELIEYVMSLPGHFKVDGKSRKKILKESFVDLLPHEIFSKRKGGFEIPVSEWFKKELKAPFFDVIGASKDILDVKEVEKIFKKHENNQENNDRLLWNIFVLNYWLSNIKVGK